MYIKSGTMGDNFITAPRKLEIGVHGTTTWCPKRSLTKSIIKKWSSLRYY